MILWRVDPAPYKYKGVHGSQALWLAALPNRSAWEGHGTVRSIGEVMQANHSRNRSGESSACIMAAQSPALSNFNVGDKGMTEKCCFNVFSHFYSTFPSFLRNIRASGSVVYNMTGSSTAEHQTKVFQVTCHSKTFKCRCQGLNLGPSACNTVALSLE